jgi:hypothetical protein
MAAPIKAVACNNASKTSPYSSLPLAGETVARFDPRLMAGAGVLAAFLLLGGSATVALADPGGPRSDRDYSSDRSNDDGNGRGGSDSGGDDRGGNGDDGSGAVDKGGVERPEVRFGSGRIDSVDVGELAPSLGAGSGGAAARSAAPDASVSGGAGAPGRSGTDHGGAPSARFDPPRVTIGNGRTPGIQKRDSEPRWRTPAVEPAPAAPAPPPAAPLPAPPPTVVAPAPTAPVLTQQLSVAPPADWSDPLWGLAGLLLIPAAGAVLGYRQARAAHAVERLRRS